MRLWILIGGTLAFADLTTTSNITVPADSGVSIGTTAEPLPAAPLQAPIVPSAIFAVTVTVNKEVATLLFGKVVCKIGVGLFAFKNAQFATCVKFVFRRLKTAISVALWAKSSACSRKNTSDVCFAVVAEVFSENIAKVAIKTIKIIAVTKLNPFLISI